MSRPAEGTAEAPLSGTLAAPAVSSSTGAVSSSEGGSTMKQPSAQPPALLAVPCSFPQQWLSFVGCWSRVNDQHCLEDILTLQPDFTFHFVRLSYYARVAGYGVPDKLDHLVTGRWSSLSAEHMPLVRDVVAGKNARDAHLRQIIKPSNRSSSSASERSQHLPELSISLERNVWTRPVETNPNLFLWYAMCLTRKGELCEYSNPYQLFTRTHEHHVKEFTHAGTMLSTSHCSRVQPQAAGAGAGGSSSAIASTPAQS